MLSVSLIVERFIIDQHWVGNTDLYVNIFFCKIAFFYLAVTFFLMIPGTQQLLKNPEKLLPMVILPDVPKENLNLQNLVLDLMLDYQNVILPKKAVINCTVFIQICNKWRNYKMTLVSRIFLLLTLFSCFYLFKIPP